MIDLFMDYETYFGPALDENGKKLNLSLQNNKISYTDYVRHPDFTVHGASLNLDGGPTEFFKAYALPGVFTRIGEEIGWKNVRIIAHNALFEGLINYEKYGVVPGEYFCTLAAADAIFQGSTSVGLDPLSKLLLGREKLPDLHSFRGIKTEDITPEQWEILANYANNDVDLTMGIYPFMRNGLPEAEHKLMDKTLMLFADPVLEVDISMATEALSDAETELAEKVAATGLTKEQISGNNSFEAALKDQLGFVPTKVNKDGVTKPAFAKTDLDFVRLKSHPDARVRALVEARQEVKSSLGITRARRLLDLGTQGSRKLPVCLHYARAHTMRWTGGNKVNLQNLTRGSKLRRSIIAPEGHQLVVVDSSQIECRTLAWMAGQEDLLQQFRDHLDPYAIMAGKVFGFEVTKEEHPDERFMGKTMVLGLGYNMGWRKFYNEIVTGARGQAMDIKPELAQQAVATYRSTNDKIVALWKTAEDVWLNHLVNGTGKKEVMDGALTLDADNDMIIFPNGCFLRYADITYNNTEGQYQYTIDLKGKKYSKGIYGGLLVENVTQAIARHIVAGQILAIADRYRPVLFVHDECVYLSRDDEVDTALEFGLEQFRINPRWTDIPLDSEGGYDRCYSK